jgi:hypothetical protein
MPQAQDGQALSVWRSHALAVTAHHNSFLPSGHSAALRARYGEFARQSFLKQFLTEGERCDAWGCELSGCELSGWGCARVRRAASVCAAVETCVCYLLSIIFVSYFAGTL